MKRSRYKEEYTTPCWSICVRSYDIFQWILPLPLRWLECCLFMRLKVNLDPLQVTEYHAVRGTRREHSSLLLQL